GPARKRRISLGPILARLASRARRIRVRRVIVPFSPKGVSMARHNAHFGWLPDLPDQRDHLYAAPPAVLRKLPRRVDLRAQCPPALQPSRRHVPTGKPLITRRSVISAWCRSIPR